MADEGQFSDWLRVQLRSRRMSLRQLADRSGVNVSTVSRIVQGKRRPSLSTALRLSRVLAPGPGGANPVLPLDLARSEADAVTNVERALRSDPRLSDAAVRRVMTLYHALRSEAGSSVEIRRTRPTDTPVNRRRTG
jgi:transcriptional regulator with XRE-family HTH domain